MERRGGRPSRGGRHRLAPIVRVAGAAPRGISGAAAVGKGCPGTISSLSFSTRRDSGSSARVGAPCRVRSRHERLLSLHAGTKKDRGQNVVLCPRSSRARCVYGQVIGGPTKGRRRPASHRPWRGAEAITSHVAAAVINMCLPSLPTRPSRNRDHQSISRAVARCQGVLLFALYRHNSYHHMNWPLDSAVGGN